MTEAEVEVVTETENLGDAVAKELRDCSEESWAVDVGDEETRADLVSLTLG